MSEYSCGCGNNAEWFIASVTNGKQSAARYCTECSKSIWHYRVFRASQAWTQTRIGTTRQQDDAALAWAILESSIDSITRARQLGAS